MPAGAKFGGRQKGTPNKVTKDLIEILEDKNFSPVAEMIWVFNEAKEQYRKRMTVKKGMGSSEFLQIAERAASELCNYVYPKRKAVEHTGKGGENLFGSLAELAKKIADNKEEPPKE